MLAKFEVARVSDIKMKRKCHTEKKRDTAVTVTHDQNVQISNSKYSKMKFRKSKIYMHTSCKMYFYGEGHRSKTIKVNNLLK